MILSQPSQRPSRAEFVHSLRRGLATGFLALNISAIVIGLYVYLIAALSYSIELPISYDEYLKCFVYRLCTLHVMLFYVENLLPFIIVSCAVSFGLLTCSKSRCAAPG